VIREDPGKLRPLAAAASFSLLVTSLLLAIGSLSHTYTPFTPVIGGHTPVGIPAGLVQSMALEGAVTFGALVVLSRAVEVLLADRDDVLR
jgi:hypothetical protein